MCGSVNPVPIDISFLLPKPVTDIVKGDPLSSTMKNWQLAFIASRFVSLVIGLVEMDQCFNFTKRIKVTELLTARRQIALMRRLGDALQVWLSNSFTSHSIPVMGYFFS